MGSKLHAPGPPCSILSVSGGGGTHQESWREARRGLSHELVARVRVGQARAITCRVLFQNSVAAFDLQHAPQTTDVSFSAPVVSVNECQKNESIQHQPSLDQSSQVSTIGRQPTGHFRPRE